MNTQEKMQKRMMTNTISLLILFYKCNNELVTHYCIENFIEVV